MRVYDVIGIGIGPSNLSTAALLQPLAQQVDAIFFDDKPAFSWHAGLMFPDAKLQVSILKDLVTMIDPTSAFSFLNYLKEQKRLYIFAARNGFNNVTRREFEQYLQWVVSRLDNLHFNSTVEAISHDGNAFLVQVGAQSYKSRNILMGAGLTSTIPDCCRPWLCSTLFHSSQFLKQYHQYQDKTVTLIGGGQSSCEILKYLLQQPEDLLPTRINWIFKNHKLNLLEDTPFANELYTPNYSDYIYSLEQTQRARLIEEQKFTSDGVSESTIKEVYELLYHAKFNTACTIQIYHDAALTGLEQTASQYSLAVNNDPPSLTSDIVILGTGFHYKIPACITALAQHYQTQNGVFVVDKQFRLLPKTAVPGDVFIHNGAKHVRGVADPNLSLVAWRSGIIINTLLGTDIYAVDNEKTIINWSHR